LASPRHKEVKEDLGWLGIIDQSGFQPLLQSVKEKRMLRKSLALALIASVIHAAGVGPSLASSQADRQVRLAAKVKAAVSQLGLGEEARIAVKLKDKTKLTGYLSQVGKTASSSPI
jgi:hypothetical protein